MEEHTHGGDIHVWDIHMDKAYIRRNIHSEGHKTYTRRGHTYGGTYTRRNIPKEKHAYGETLTRRDMHTEGTYTRWDICKHRQLGPTHGQDIHTLHTMESRDIHTPGYTIHK